MFNDMPKLPSRQDIFDKFSMYLTIETSQDYSLIKWKTDKNLKKNVDLYKIKNPKLASLSNSEDKKREIVKFWVDMALYNLPVKEEWEPENRVQKAWEHLTVYCEESCYWAAFQIWKDDKSKSWEEYIFISRCCIYESSKFEQILAKYNSLHSSLDTYITKILVNIVKNKATVAKFSKWRLLQQKSDKELKEALIRDGRKEAEVSRLLFARKYFKQVYQINKIQNPNQQSGKKYPEPDNDDFATSAKFYNQEKSLNNSPHEVSIAANITVEELKLWMEVCIAALHKYPRSITPQFSFDALQEKGDIAEIENTFLSTSSELEDSFQRYGELLNKIEPALQEQLFLLKPEQQKIMLIYYGLQFKQSQIAERYKITQGAIARRLQKIEINFIKIILQFSQPSRWAKQYISRWLVSNYSSPDNFDLIHTALVNGIKKLEAREQEILKLLYGDKLNEQTISRYLSISQDELVEVIRKITSQLEFILIKSIDELIRKYLNLWLAKTYRKIIQNTCKNLSILTNDTTDSEIIDFILDKSLENLQTNQ